MTLLRATIFLIACWWVPAPAVATSLPDGLSTIGLPVLTAPPADLTSVNRFGASVAIAGNLGIIGNPTFPSVEGPPTALVVDLGSGAEVARLEVELSDEDRRRDIAAEFGASLATDGTSVVVGAPSHQLIGAIYVFDLETASLVAPPIQRGAGPPYPSYTGRSVAIDNGRLVAGAPGHTNPRVTEEFMQGRVYVGTERFVFPINPPAETRTPLSFFGTSVAISGNTLVVGDDADLTDYAYVYNPLTGGLRFLLASPESRPEVGFGLAVAINEDRIFVSSRNGGLDQAGAVHIFDRETGVHLMDLNNPEPIAFSRFGSTLAVHEDRLVVGAPNAISGAGAAYVFDVYDGLIVERLVAESPVAGAGFGSAVAISESAILVSAPHARDQPGEVYIRRYIVPEPITASTLVCCVALAGMPRRR